MISPRLFRRRIRSVQGTAKITKAMEMIATARMRRAQENALAGRPYAEKIAQVIADLAAQPPLDSSRHPLLQEREVKKIAIVHITSDRGLCGGFNANVNRITANFVIGQSIPVVIITVGRKGRDFMLRHHLSVRAAFTELSARPSLLDILPVSRVIIDDYSAGYVDLVYLAYTRFVTTAVQHPVLRGECDA
jgi:F-type H+-transporting ATPase subunit gamma